MCCTVQDDFVPSIKALLEFNPRIESIIIETSGLALPIPLIQALNWPEIRSSIYLDVVVGIVNGESMLNGSPINDLNKITKQFNDTDKINHNATIEELYEEQLEVSDIVLVSRSDILNDDQFDVVKNKIQGELLLMEQNHLEQYNINIHCLIRLHSRLQIHRIYHNF